MSYRVQVCQVGPNGGMIGSPETFEAATKDDAISLAKNEIRRVPRAANRSMFNIYDSAHRMILSYISTPEPSRRL